jgi:hypothetical protein
VHRRVEKVHPSDAPTNPRIEKVRRHIERVHRRVEKVHPSDVPTSPRVEKVRRHIEKVHLADVPVLLRR